MVVDGTEFVLVSVLVACERTKQFGDLSYHTLLCGLAKPAPSQLTLTIRALLLGLHDCLAAAAVWEVVARSIFLER